MIKKISMTVLLSLGICSASFAALHPVVLDQTIAIVNNGVVTQSQLNAATHQAMQELTASGQTAPSKLALERRVLQQLIRQKIILQLAAKNNLQVTAAEVDHAITQLAAHNHLSVAAFEAQIKSQGIELNLFKTQLKNDLIVHQLELAAVAPSITITPAEVQTFLKNQASLPNPNTEYEVAHILIALPKNPTPSAIAATKQHAEHVRAMINSGTSFTVAAVKYSQSSDASRGGVLPDQTLMQLPTIFVRPLQDMQVGQVYGPFKTASGFHIIKLLAVKTPAPVSHMITQYHVRQIVIKTSPIVSSAEAQRELQVLRQKIIAGENFATAAEANSQDYNSNRQGGDLGWLSIQQLPPAIAAEVPKLAQHTPSLPIEIGKTWRIVEVIGQRQYDNTDNYREAQARKTIFNRKAEQALLSWQAQIRGQSYVKILIPDLVVKSN